jgi:hypothetical protein
MTAAATQPETYEAPKPTVRTDRDRFAVKLFHSVTASDKRLAPFQKRTKQYLTAFAGPYYNTAGKVATEQPLNSVYSFVRAIKPALKMLEINALGSSTIPSMRRAAELVGLATTRELAAMHAAQTYTEVLFASFFGPALTKIGIARGPMAGTPDFRDWRQDPGRVFWRPISFDDWILDPRCRRREEAQMEGDKYIICKEDAEAHGYKKDVLEKLDTLLMKRMAEGTTRGMSSPGGTDDDPLYVEYRFADIWLSRENVVVTIAIDEGADSFGFLDEVEGDGPEGGPYDMLTIGELPPDNPLPVTPVEQIMDLHEAQNVLARKAKEQGESEKTIWAYGVQSEADAKRASGAPTHTMVPMMDPKSIQELNFPGASRELLDTIAIFQQWSNRNGPNVDLVGGQKADSGTLGQDQMLFAQSGEVIDDMKAAAQTFLEGCVRRVAWYVWGREESMPVMLKMAGEEFPLTWGPEERPIETLGDFLDLAFKVSVYQMGLDSPKQQYARTNDLIANVVVPLMPQAMAQGVYVDMAKLIASQAKKANIDDTEEWLTVGVPAGAGANQQTPNGQGGEETTNISQGGASGRPATQPRPQTTGEPT